MQDYLKELDSIELPEEGDYAIIRDKLFSLEGRASNEYWRLMRLLLSPELGFNGRRRRGANDLVNCLLNYGYGILYQRAWKAKGKRGADLQVDKNGILPKGTRDKTINAVIKRLSSLVNFRGEKIKLEDVITNQAKNLVKCLEGKQKYRPFLIRY